MEKEFKQFAVVVALALLGLIGCTKQENGGQINTNPGNAAASSTNAAAVDSLASTTNRQEFSVKGVIQVVRRQEGKLIVKHEEIPNYMPAMTMPLDVKNTNEMAGLAPGDEIKFQMVVTEDDGWIEQIEKIGQTNLTERPSVRLVREVEPLEEGMKLTDYTLTNSLSQAFKLSDFKGQALVFSFIFTRCPFPLFCPKMNENFRDAYHALMADKTAPTNWHFLSISFDPHFDTPQRLHEYSQRYQPDPAKWNFATGAMLDIDAITEQFGVEIAFQAGNFDHKLRTVVVDGTGTIQKIFVGNQWPVEELVHEIKAATTKR